MWPGLADTGIFLGWLWNRSGLAPSANHSTKKRLCLFLSVSEHMLLPPKVPRQESAVNSFFYHTVLLTLRQKCQRWQTLLLAELQLMDRSVPFLLADLI